MKPKGIVIHCSDSPHGRGDDASTIDRWHKERGFKRTHKGTTYHIGYHKVITEDGTIQDGRPLAITGAHASGYNNYIGICMIGISKFTDEQFMSLVSLIKELVNEFDIKPDDILGHYEVSTKTCPNFDVRQLVSNLFYE